MTDTQGTSQSRRWREAIDLAPSDPELTALSLKLMQIFTSLSSRDDRLAVLNYAQRLLLLQTSR